MNAADKATNFVVIGHRGARGHAPENTLLAIDTGIRLGAQMVEFDVQVVDGHLVLMHDLRLDRTTSGSGLLQDWHFDDLRQLDAGQGERIPTLDEALQLIDRRVPVNIELKTGQGTAAPVAALLAGYLDRGWAPEQFLVSSFHLPELFEFTQLLPQVPVGALFGGVPLDWAASATALGATHLNIGADFVDPRLVADAKARGLKVMVYTVNHEDDVRQLRDAGVDGVFSDYPDRALKALG